MYFIKNGHDLNIHFVIFCIMQKHGDLETFLCCVLCKGQLQCVFVLNIKKYVVSYAEFVPWWCMFTIFHLHCCGDMITPVTFHVMRTMTLVHLGGHFLYFFLSAREYWLKHSIWIIWIAPQTDVNCMPYLTYEQRFLNTWHIYWYILCQ